MSVQRDGDDREKTGKVKKKISVWDFLNHRHWHFLFPLFKGRSFSFFFHQSLTGLTERQEAFL